MERSHTTADTRRLTIERFNTARRVWAAVSKRPNAFYWELAQMAGCSITSVCWAMHLLREMGYVAFENEKKAARRVLVPFV